MHLQIQVVKAVLSAGRGEEDLRVVKRTWATGMNHESMIFRLHSAVRCSVLRCAQCGASWLYAVFEYLSDKLAC